MCIRDSPTHSTTSRRGRGRWVSEVWGLRQRNNANPRRRHHEERARDPRPKARSGSLVRAEAEGPATLGVQPPRVDVVDDLLVELRRFKQGRLGIQVLSPEVGLRERLGGIEAPDHLKLEGGPDVPEELLVQRAQFIGIEDEAHDGVQLRRLNR
eukprot:7641728-Pyramimonas_sp.AAC.1